MSNPAPTLNQINAFNATQGTTIDFNIIGGTEVIRSNKIYIYDLSDNSLICTHLYVSTESIHELPANTSSSIVYASGKSSADFTNNTQYYAQIQTYTDTAGTQGGSGLSVAKMFWCLVDPTLTITTIPSTISTTSYNVSATYDANTSVVSNIIQQYQFNLYSATGSLLQSSGVVVGNGEQQGISTAYDISYNFTGLSVGSSYYVTVDVTTTQGMSVSAQSGTFTVSIDTPTLGEATVVNNACDGYISVTSNLSSEYGGSASGEIASFVTDSVNNVSSLKVNLEPLQDLHGYDKPWVGGGGNNIYQPQEGTTNGITFKTQEDGTTKITGTANVSTWTFLDKVVDLPFMGISAGDIVAVYSDAYLILQTSNGGSWSTRAYSYETAGYGQIPSDATKIRFLQYPENTVTEAGTTFNFNAHYYVAKGSTFTSWTPWENLCPITGWTGCEVINDPTYGGYINWNQNVEHGNFDASTGWSGAGYGTITVNDNICSLKITEVSTSARIQRTVANAVIGHKYLLTFDINPPKAVDCSLRYSANSVVPSRLSVQANKWSTCSAIATSTGTGNTLYLYTDLVTAKLALNDVVQFRNIMTFDLTAMFGAGNEPSTVDEFKAIFPNAYYPYNSGTKTNASAVNGTPYGQYSITWQTEAGTVYGGTVDVVTGVLTVDRVTHNYTANDVIRSGGISDLSTADNQITRVSYNKSGNPTIPTAPQPTDAEQDKGRFSHGDYYATNSGWSSKTYHGYAAGDSSHIFIKCAPNEMAVNAYLTEQVNAGTPVQMVVPLANPQTYQLTPQEIQTLVGQNNVWSEQGSVAVVYNIPITKLLVKRQDVADVSGTWLTLHSQPITQASDMDFTFIDFLNQYGKTYKYALVPLLTQTQSGVIVEIEGGYTVSDSVDSIFDGVYIADQTNVERVKAGVGYGNIDMNQGVGSITPIGSKYPVVITNSQNQYHNGSIRGTIVPNDFYSNGNLSRIDMVNKRDELEQFLTNKRAKIIKDWNGKMWLVMIMSNVNCSFDDNYGMGMVSFSADWLEVGDPTNQQDLYNAGLINVGGV